MKTTNAKLLYYDKYVDCTYPTGKYFMLNVDYIHSVVQNILKAYDKKIGTLYLVGTNRSGNIKNTDCLVILLLIVLFKNENKYNN